MFHSFVRWRVITQLFLRWLVWGRPRCWMWWGGFCSLRTWWCPREEKGSPATATSPSSTSSRERLTPRRCGTLFELDQFQNKISAFFYFLTFFGFCRCIKAFKGSGSANLPTSFPGVLPVSRWLYPGGPHTWLRLTESAAWWWPTTRASPP